MVGGCTVIAVALKKPAFSGLLMCVCVFVCPPFGLCGRSEIARHMPRRIGKRCRERWENHLKAGLRKDRWSAEEETVLIEARERLGNRWTDIAKMLDGRSVNQCKNHWYSIARRQSAQATTPTDASPSKPTPTCTAKSTPPKTHSKPKKATPTHTSTTSLDPPAAPAAPQPASHALHASSALLALAAGAAMVSTSSSTHPTTHLTSIPTTTDAPRRKRQLSSASPDPYTAPLAAPGRKPIRFAALPVPAPLPSSHPSLDGPDWSSAEDALLLAGVGESGRRWSSLCKTVLVGRSPVGARARYFALTLGHTQGPLLEPWGDADFKLLREAYRCVGISRFLGTVPFGD